MGTKLLAHSIIIITTSNVKWHNFFLVVIRINQDLLRSVRKCVQICYSVNKFITFGNNPCKNNHPNPKFELKSDCDVFRL